MYTPEQIEQVEQHHNWFVRQDSDGNLVWNNASTAETGWRPVSVEQIAEALKGSQTDSIRIDEFGRSPDAAKIENHNLGRFGRTAIGKQVQLYGSGQRVRIIKVYTAIHTGVSGQSNYVYADVEAQA